MIQRSALHGGSAGNTSRCLQGVGTHGRFGSSIALMSGCRTLVGSIDIVEPFNLVRQSRGPTLKHHGFLGERIPDTLLRACSSPRRGIPRLIVTTCCTRLEFIYFGQVTDTSLKAIQYMFDTSRGETGSIDPEFMHLSTSRHMGSRFRCIMKSDSMESAMSNCC